MLSVLWASPAWGYRLRGEVVAIGFRGTGGADSLQGAYHYRPGNWVPVLVELTNDTGDRFQGTVEVRQVDDDGDEVLARREVYVEGTRQFFLYVPGGRYRSESQFQVRIYDLDGQFVEIYDSQGEPQSMLSLSGGVAAIGHRMRILLNIADRPLTELRGLANDERLTRRHFVANVGPKQLPDDAAGLDMVDIAVWDDPQPGVLDLPQKNALLGWVRQGGTLVVGVSKSWDVVSASWLAEILPARLAEPVSLDEVPEWLAPALGVTAFDTARLRPPLAYCPIRAADLIGGGAVFEPLAGAASEDRAAGSEILAARRAEGRGQVILVAARIEDLLRHGRRNADLLRELVGVRQVRATEEELDQMGNAFAARDLFTYIRHATTFGVTASLYLLFAFAFVLAYIGLATGGCWAWLSKHRIRRHAWPAFAAAGILASVVSVAAVQWIRGISYRVQELSVVDGRAGSDQAGGTLYFGLKAPRHARVDLAVPADWRKPDDPSAAANQVRPIPAQERSTGAYASVERYQAFAGAGLLRDVPLRATLKQFQADWHGRLEGRLMAELGWLKPGSADLQPESWLHNQLGTDLNDCHLFVALRNTPGNRAYRDLAIRVYRIGEFRDGQRISLRDLIDRAVDERRKAMGPQGATAQIDPDNVPIHQVLQEAQNIWLRGLGIRQQFDQYSERDRPVEITRNNVVNALLMMTLYDELDPMPFIKNGYELERTHGQQLDRSMELLREEALLVGFSAEPGPARLCYRRTGQGDGAWRPIEPAEAQVMYRLAVPVQEPTTP